MNHLTISCFLMIPSSSHFSSTSASFISFLSTVFSSFLSHRGGRRVGGGPAAAAEGLLHGPPLRQEVVADAPVSQPVEVRPQVGDAQGRRRQREHLVELRQREGPQRRARAPQAAEGLEQRQGVGRVMGCLSVRLRVDGHTGAVVDVQSVADTLVVDPKDSELEECQLLTETEHRQAVEEYGPGSFRAGMGSAWVRE